MPYRLFLDMEFYQSDFGEFGSFYRYSRENLKNNFQVSVCREYIFFLIG